jgi:hypothetical protein
MPRCFALAQAWPQLQEFSVFPKAEERDRSRSAETNE